MTWASAVKKIKYEAQASFVRPDITPSQVDWPRLVTLDFETYYDTDYTLGKMSTSEYIRDPRFKAQQVGIKIGDKPTKVYSPKTMKTALAKINWATHSVLCHNTAFDAFILHYHFKIKPAYFYDTLSMARGLHSNEIGAGLNEVAEYYGKGSKIEGALEQTKGVLDWPKALFDATAIYCAQDVDLTYAIFKEMYAKYPASEIELIDLTMRMFCDPVLKVDISRVEKELARELAERQTKFYAAVNPRDWDEQEKVLLKGKAERALEGVERDMLMIKRVIGSNERFAELLRAEGIEPPVKISPAWMKKDKKGREDETSKWTFAFAKDDLDFTNIPADINQWRGDLDPGNVADVPKIVAKQTRLEDLIACRIAVKSTTNITRAERFLTAGANGMPLPVGYSYYAAHTGRFGGNNKMNCLPGESEVLTKNGWIPLCKFDDTEQAAVWNSDTKRVQFATVAKIELEYSGPMIRAKTHTGTHDALYTPDHGIPTIAYHDRHTVTRRTAAGMLGNSDWLLPVSGEYVNDDASFAVSEPMARFAAAMQADGCIVPNSAHSTAAIFGFTKQRKVDRFRMLCTSAGLRYTETVSGEYTKFYINHGQAPLDMFKYFGPWILGMSGASIAALVDEAAYWDGHVRKSSYLYSSAVRQNAEWLQTAAHLSGRSAQMQEINNFKGWNKNPDAKLWIVNVKPRGYVVNEKDRNPLTLVDKFQGKVFCLTTPTGWFMMRHNGTIHVTGNCQNLKRGGELRQSILAPKGHQLAVCDSGQIEARVTAWLWGQDDLIQAFRDADAGTGSDAYCNFATLIYGRPITKADKTDRHLGKVCVLGLGFGMGPEKFQLTLAKGALGGPPIHFSLTECQRIVNMYRRANYKIAEGWNKCKQIIDDMANGRVGSYKCIGWEKDTIWLPNGMSLKYPDLKASIGDKGWEEYSYQAKNMRKRIYGGLLAENLAQSLARIIVMDQLRAINKKYRCVMTTHDEIIAMPRTAQAETCFKFMTKCMTTAPAWCSDLPLASEGGWSSNYSK